MNWDIVRLKNDLKNVALELKDMKKIFREPEQPRVTLKLYQECAELKQQATMLCSIRAHSRRKIHLLRLFKNLDEQEAFIKEEAAKYLLQIAAE
jgi:hypothetical protein